MRTLVKISVVLVAVLLWSSYGTRDSSTCNLIVEVNYNSYGLRGFGGYMHLKNIKTGHVYSSNSKKGFCSYIVTKDLPVGSYEVLNLEIITGGPIILVEDHRLFDTLHLEEPISYYGGNYMIKKIKPLFQYHIRITEVPSDSERKIRKKLAKHVAYPSSRPINYEQRILAQDSTELQVI